MSITELDINQCINPPPQSINASAFYGCNITCVWESPSSILSYTHLSYKSVYNRLIPDKNKNKNI
jgi:hypothetical protein